MEREIKVSVLCNVYNHGKYIRDALEGFVMQKTDFLYEVLVHDDASTDNSAEIIREYEEKYPDIIKPIYQTENQYSKRISIYRTQHLPRAKGRYIAVCEGDDFWTDPCKLQKQYDFMEDNPDYSLCACGTRWLNIRTGMEENKCHTADDRDVTAEELILGEKGMVFHYSTFFMKKDVFFKKTDWRPLFPIGDYSLAILAALNGKVRMLSDIMTTYRYYADNSWTVRMDDDESRARISLRMIEGLEALDKATDGCYAEAISKRILRHKYTHAIMTHDYNALRSGELGVVYKSRSLMYRFSDMLRCKHPRLYTVIMKPIARMVKSASAR